RTAARPHRRRAAGSRVRALSQLPRAKRLLPSRRQRHRRASGYCLRLRGSGNSPLRPRPGHGAAVVLATSQRAAAPRCRAPLHPRGRASAGRGRLRPAARSPDHPCHPRAVRPAGGQDPGFLRQRPATPASGRLAAPARRGRPGRAVSGPADGNGSRRLPAARATHSPDAHQQILDRLARYPPPAFAEGFLAMTQSTLPADYTPPADLLRDKVVLITGAAAGLGRALALQCAAHGATVVLLDRQVRQLEQLYDEIEATGGPQPVIYPPHPEGASTDDRPPMAQALAVNS